MSKNKVVKKRVVFVDSESGSWDGWGYTIKIPKDTNIRTAWEFKFIDVDNELGIDVAKEILEGIAKGFTFKLRSKGKTRNYSGYEETETPAYVYIFDKIEKKK